MILFCARLILLCVAMAAIAAPCHAGMDEKTPYTNRGQTDFDTFLQLLNPYGTWSKIEGKWAYTPQDHLTPYTNGRWIYTEYGWYWKGTLPHSWATEHYGYWKRTNKVWSWYPGPFWLPQIVEIRATSSHIGWRSGAVDEHGNYIEAPIDRYSKPEEWTFVTLEQFANPITPEIVAKPSVSEAQLDDSTSCRHTYLTYREIDRPGPHPADFAELCHDGGMLAPHSSHEANAKLSPDSKATDANATTASINPAADTRKVNYWITLSLSGYWAKLPEEAKPEEIYLYRPEIYQDEDGIARRITLWFNPGARTSLADVLNQSAPAAKDYQERHSGEAAEQAVSSEANSTQNPFRSPLDERPHNDNTVSPVPPKTTSTKNPAPSGLRAPSEIAPTTNLPPSR